jgi:hypothetical protein
MLYNKKQTVFRIKMLQYFEFIKKITTKNLQYRMLLVHSTYKQYKYVIFFAIYQLLVLHEKPMVYSKLYKGNNICAST